MSLVLQLPGQHEGMLATVSSAEQPAASEERHNSLPHATVSDMAHLQRATASCMVPLRSLGRGAFAAVELVSMPVAGKRKLVVCKKLMTEDMLQQDTSSTKPHQQQQEQQPQQQQTQEGQQQQQEEPVQQLQQQTQQQTGQQQQQTQQRPRPCPLPPMKASSVSDWSREVSMHRETAGCPFVLQLLAAKRCRAGNMLLLTEYAAAGTLTDVLARLRLQQHKARRAEQEHTFRRCQSAAAMLQDVNQLQQQQLPAQDTLSQAAEPSVMCAASSASVAALFDSLADSHMPTAMLIHGVDIDLAACEAIAAAAGAGAGAAAGGAAAGGAAAGQPEQHVAGLSEASARFYTACILMGLQWLHSRRILHRDIKPCNLLLFSDGYLKLADLGCCCLLPSGVDSARTRTGTAQYMAPEVVAPAHTAGYSFPVDMWSLGVTLWQMVAGSLPDWAEAQTHHNTNHSTQQQQQQDLHAVHSTEEALMLPLEPASACHTTPQDLQFPDSFSQELCDLLRGLLQTDSSARLSIPQVQASPWFKGFDWQALQDKTLTPPSLPAHP